MASEGPALTGDERAELERLRAENAALRIGAVALACLALVFWGRPTGKVVLGLTLALLVVLALIEFLGRRPAQAPVEAPVE